MINDDIEIFVIAIHNDNVHIGIKAPKEIVIHRREVYDAIVREKKSSL